MKLLCQMSLEAALPCQRPSVGHPKPAVGTDRGTEGRTRGAVFFQRIHRAGLVVNASKCQLARSEVCYLGYSYLTSDRLDGRLPQFSAAIY